jgi:hypothetical protein
MKLDEFLPAYEFNEIHTVTVNAPPARVFTALKELTVAELSPLILLMLGIRALPARLLKKPAPYRSFQVGPFLEQMYKGGFIPLAEEPGSELVFGMVGQFWKVNGGVEMHIPDAAAFLAFDDPAFAKVAANLWVSEKDGRIFCSTETRIHVPEPSTRRKFAFYWRIISMGSAFIRILWLRAIKKKAERQT